MIFYQFILICPNIHFTNILFYIFYFFKTILAVISLAPLLKSIYSPGQVAARVRDVAADPALPFLHHPLCIRHTQVPILYYLKKLEVIIEDIQSLKKIYNYVSFDNSVCYAFTKEYIVLSLYGLLYCEPITTELDCNWLIIGKDCHVKIKIKERRYNK